MKGNAKYRDVIVAIDTYVREERRVGLPAMPELSKPFALCAEAATDLSPADTSGCWPDEWPGSKRPGVYFFFDGQLGLLYVGKASMGQVIGTRVSKYFTVDRERPEGCCPKKDHMWSSPPEYFVKIYMNLYRVF
jgi:hypothetical protein